MAKNKGKRAGSPRETIKVVVLLVFIVIGISVILGSLWYYNSFVPRAVTELDRVATEFTQQYFTVDHSSITGQEGQEYMTQQLLERVSAGDRVEMWQQREISAQVVEQPEIYVQDQDFRTATVRAEFWQHEQSQEQEGRQYLMYYDYEFVRQQGQWRVDAIHTGTEEGLQDLRRREGVLEEHYQIGADEDEEDEAAEDDEEDSEQDTE